MAKLSVPGVSADAMRAVFSEMGRRSGKVANKPGRFGVIDKTLHQAIASAGGKAGKGRPKVRKAVKE